jgi:hypothetical protein
VIIVAPYTPRFSATSPLGLPASECCSCDGSRQCPTPISNAFSSPEVTTCIYVPVVVGREGRPWEPFSASLPPHPTRAPGRFNLFLGPQAPSVQGCLEPPQPDRGSRFRHTPPSPPLPSRPILRPQALSPKWTSLDLLCGSWLAVYIGCCSHLAFVLRL